MYGIVAAAPAGVRAGLPVLALGRAAAAFYQTAAGRAALRDGDAAAVDEPAPPSEDGSGEPGSEAADLDSLAN